MIRGAGSGAHAQTNGQLAEEIRQLRTSTAAEVEQARAIAARDIEQAREEAARLVSDATSQLRRAEQETQRSQQSEAAALQRADRAQAQDDEEIARIRADAQRERDELHAATDARLAALDEASTALRIRAERAEADLDAARSENHRLTEQLTQATADDDHAHVSDSTPIPRRAGKTAATRKPPGTQG